MSRSSLKLLALISMFCDHFSKVVLSAGILVPKIGVTANFWVRVMLCSFGTMAFPLFAFFTAEGCRKTGHPGKYLLRLFLFGVLSEAPFQLCFRSAYRDGFTIGCHNVMFTLFLAAGAVFLARWLIGHKVPEIPAKLLTAAAAIVLGWVLYTDYNAWGVALVLGIYYLPEEKERFTFMGAWITCFYLIWHGWNGSGLAWITDNQYQLILYWIGSMLSVPFAAIYNGEKGRNIKWLFYGFYPTHLLLLYGIRALILH